VVSVAESRIKPENYITIQGWMITELGLRGNALLLYALIYGFSQDGKSGFSGRQDYLMEWLHCTRQSVTNLMGKLADQGLIRRTRSATGEIIYQAVRCKNILHDVKKVDTECQKTLHGDVKKVDTECQKTLHLPINNNIHNTIDSDSVKEDFTPPTVEEVGNYCRERGNGIDPQRFVDYYTAQKWVRNGQPIDDWQLIIRLWETNGREDNKPGKPAEQYNGGSFDTDEFFEAALRRSYADVAVWDINGGK
jgi:hypothetical protein